MASVYGSNVPTVFHKTLNIIWGDETKTEPSWKGYLEEKTVSKRWFEDIEMVDPGLWDETDEGNDLALDEYSEGIVVRFRPVKFSKRLVIPEEIIEDAEYERAYDATRMLGRTCVQTQNYNAVAILNNAFDSNFVGGDGLEMCSTLHVIKGGATVSNELATPLSPSNTAVQTMLIACEKMPGTNGYVTGIRMTKLFGPSNHKWRFKEILKSEKRDDTSNNAVNALKGELSDQYASVPEMTSTTNWFAKTNAMGGGRFFWRRKPRFRQTPSYEDETTVYTGSARWVVGYANWRWVHGSAI